MDNNNIPLTKADVLYLQQGLNALIKEVIQSKEAIATQIEFSHIDNSADNILTYFCKRHKQLQDLKTKLLNYKTD